MICVVCLVWFVWFLLVYFGCFDLVVCLSVIVFDLVLCMVWIWFVIVDWCWVSNSVVICGAIWTWSTWMFDLLIVLLLYLSCVLICALTYCCCVVWCFCDFWVCSCLILLGLISFALWLIIVLLYSFVWFSLFLIVCFSVSVWFWCCVIVFTTWIGVCFDCCIILVLMFGDFVCLFRFASSVGLSWLVSFIACTFWLQFVLGVIN